MTIASKSDELLPLQDRLGGLKRFQIEIDSFELERRASGNKGDYISHLARPIGPCAHCKGLKIDEMKDLARDTLRIQFSCARSKPDSRLKCDDGTEAYINERMEIVAIPTRRVTSTWADLVSTPRTSMMSNANVWLDEYMTHPEVNAARPALKPKPINKDLPQTTTEGGDAW